MICVAFNMPGGPSLPGISKEEIVLSSQQQKVFTTKKNLENEMLLQENEFVGNSIISGDSGLSTSNISSGGSTSKFEPNTIVGEKGSTYSFCVTGATGITGYKGATGITGVEFPKGCTCTFSPTGPDGVWGYCCDCPTIPRFSPEAQLRNLAQVNDFFNFFNNITTNIASIKVYQEEVVYFNRKVKPLLDTVNSLSFALQNAAVATQVIQAIPFSHKCQIKETLELNQELVKETMCMVQVLKKRLSIFRSMAMMDIERVGCMEKTGCMTNKCNLDDCESKCKKCKMPKCKCQCDYECERD